MAPQPVDSLPSGGLAPEERWLARHRFIFFIKLGDGSTNVERGGHRLPGQQYNSTLRLRVFVACKTCFSGDRRALQVPLAYVSVSSPGAGCLWTGPFVKREQEAFGEIRTVRVSSDVGLVWYLGVGRVDTMNLRCACRPMWVL